MIFTFTPLKYGLAMFLATVTYNSIPSAPIPKPLAPIDFEYPTSVGMKWTYSNEDFITEYELTNHKIVDNVKYISLTLACGGVFDAENSDVIRVSKSDIVRVVNGGVELDPGFRILNLPVMVGDKWKWCPRSGGLVQVTSSVAKVETVTVPAGDFRCIRIDQIQEDVVDGTKTVSSYWYSSGVGLVQIKEDGKYTKLHKFIRVECK